MERREEHAPGERLAHVLGRTVIDQAGMTLGVVVGRIITGTTIDLLVRPRRLMHRSRYLRLHGAAITVGEQTLVYHRAAGRHSVDLAVVPTGNDGDHATGDAA